MSLVTPTEHEKAYEAGARRGEEETVERVIKAIEYLLYKHQQPAHNQWLEGYETGLGHILGYLATGQWKDLR